MQLLAGLGLPPPSVSWGVRYGRALAARLPDMDGQQVGSWLPG